jgi:hypothetical protein
MDWLRANQWGPAAAWLAGAATVAAVVVALWQADNARRESMRLQFARLVDQKSADGVSASKRLRIWAAIIGMDMDFAAWIDKLQTGSIDSIPEEIRRFSCEWQNRIEPPLFVALLVLRGTDLYGPVGEVNDIINEMKTTGLEPIRQAVKDRRRPDTQPITSMWENVWNRRNEHLTLARQHFSLNREDVEKTVQG